MPKLTTGGLQSVREHDNMLRQMQELKQLSQHCVDGIKQFGEDLAENQRRGAKGGEKTQPLWRKLSVRSVRNKGTTNATVRRDGVGRLEEASPKPFSEGGRKSAAVLKTPTEMFNTGSLSSTCNSLVAEGNIEGSDCQITIDTGSNISIVRPDVL